MSRNRTNPPLFLSVSSGIRQVKKMSMETLNVASTELWHWSNTWRYRSGAWTAFRATRDPTTAHACTWDPLNVGNATESDETLVGRAVCLLDSSADSVTTEKTMGSQRLPQIHSERSYCVVCLVLVFTTVRFQSAMLGKKCFSFSKQHNVLFLCIILPHRCKLIREMSTARRTPALSIYSARFRRIPKQWREQHKEVQQHHTPSLSCFQ